MTNNEPKEPLPPGNHSHGKSQSHHTVHDNKSEYTRVYQVGSNYTAPNRPLIKYLNVKKLHKIPTYRSD